MYRRVGLGAAAAGTTDAATAANCFKQYAADIAAYGPILGPANTLTNPNCYSVIYQQMMYGTLPAVPEAVAKAVPTPPSQDFIDTHTPDEVAQYLAQSQHDNAIAAAQATIQDSIDSGSYDPAGVLPTVPGSLPSTTLVLILVGVAVAAVVLIGGRR